MPVRPIITVTRNNSVVQPVGFSGLGNWFSSAVQSVTKPVAHAVETVAKVAAKPVVYAVTAPVGLVAPKLASNINQAILQHPAQTAKTITKAALKPVVYTATAPLNVLKATKPIASAINSTILNNSNTAAALLAAAGGAAYTPGSVGGTATVGGSAGPSYLPQATPVIPAAPAGAARISSSLPAKAVAPAVAASVAPAVAASVAPAVAASVAPTVAASVAPSIIKTGADLLTTGMQTAAPLIPTIVGAGNGNYNNVGSGGGYGAPVTLAPDQAAAANQSGGLPTWAAPAMLGAGVLALALLNS